MSRNIFLVDSCILLVSVLTGIGQKGHHHVGVTTDSSVLVVLLLVVVLPLSTGAVRCGVSIWASSVTAVQGSIFNI